MLLTCHTLHRTLLQMGVALRGPVSVALGRRGGKGVGPILLILAFRFTKVAVGSFGGLFFFLFFTIFCGIAKFSHLRIIFFSF